MISTLCQIIQFQVSLNHNCFLRKFVTFLRRKRGKVKPRRSAGFLETFDTLILLAPMTATHQLSLTKTGHGVCDDR